MAANEELVEAVAQAIHGAEVGWRSALGTNTPKRIKAVSDARNCRDRWLLLAEGER